jgi:hypothetical protein
MIIALKNFGLFFSAVACGYLQYNCEMFFMQDLYKPFWQVSWP